VNLNAALTGAAVSSLERQRYWARAELAHVLASGAVGVLRKDHVTGLGAAVLYATQAIVAKEANLIGATFTTANYETLTQPLDAVLVMPSGY
jgi:demethoxyubiquinone hydroxylase (CLK1/Coq7/Cat5 family)